MNFSSSEENYIKTIFHLQTESGTVTTNAVAQNLQTRPASVTDMMKKLNAKKLLHYKPYYGFSLSNEGKKIALTIIRRHRLWEAFLSEKLGFSWEEVHPVAEELEHVSSKKLIDKLDKYLNFPQFDPHGDPIPDSKGKLKAQDTLTLAQASINHLVEVVRVSNQSATMLELLQHKNIGIGTRLEVKKQFHFDQSLEIRLKPNTTVMVSGQLAQNIFVKNE